MSSTIAFVQAVERNKSSITCIKEKRGENILNPKYTQMYDDLLRLKHFKSELAAFVKPCVM